MTTSITDERIRKGEHILYAYKSFEETSLSLYRDDEYGIAGFNVDIIKAVCGEMEKSCEFFNLHNYGLAWDSSKQESRGVYSKCCEKNRLRLG